MTKRERKEYRELVKSKSQIWHQTWWNCTKPHYNNTVTTNDYKDLYDLSLDIIKTLTEIASKCEKSKYHISLLFLKTSSNVEIFSYLVNKVTELTDDLIKIAEYATNQLHDMIMAIQHGGLKVC